MKEVHLDLASFLSLVFETVKGFGGLSTLPILSAVITLLVSSLKVAPITRLVWSRLGWAQVLVAPLLGVLAGILGLGAGGAPVTLPLVLAYLATGAGSVFLHELLDGLKGAPALGPVYRALIGWVEALLAPKAPVESKTAPAAIPANPGPDADLPRYRIGNRLQ